MIRIGIALAALTTAIHILIGTADTLAPMLAAGLDPAVAGTLHACWHILSVILIYSTYIFWRRGAAAWDFAMIWVAGAVIFAAVGVWQQGLRGLITLPQWTLLAAAGGCMMAGLARPGAARA